MERNNVDPVYGYVDNKVKLLKREIKQLKNAHDAIANQHAKMLLELQRYIAGQKVNSDVDNFTSIIDNQLSNESSMRTQVLTEAVAIKSQVLTSDNPIGLTAKFYERWKEALRNSGAKFINY